MEAEKEWQKRICVAYTSQRKSGVNLDQGNGVCSVLLTVLSLKNMKN